MTIPTFDEAKLKELFKSAFIEVLEERRDLIRDVLEEAIEDIALTHAIEEGAGGARVSRQDVITLVDASLA
jgi:hypothetical protein